VGTTIQADDDAPAMRAEEVRHWPQWATGRGIPEERDPGEIGPRSIATPGCRLACGKEAGPQSPAQTTLGTALHPPHADVTH
jgi:hypothetical protein